MAMRPRTTGTSQGGAPIRPVYEDFKPTSEWIQDQESDILLIYLPGFSKESLKVSTEGRNILRVRGERLVTANKWQRFQEDFQIPDHCNLRGTRARFEGGILTMTVPKKTPTSQKPPEILPSKPPPAPKEPVSQKVQETIPPKTAASNEEAKAFQESYLPPKVTKYPNSQNVNKNIPPKVTAPYKNDNAFQESPVSPNTKAPVSDQAFSNQEKLTKTTAIEQKQNVDSRASKRQETVSGSNAQHGYGSNAKQELVERKIQDSEKIQTQKTQNLDEERKLVVNMGAAVLVLMALGAYIYHTVKP